MPEKAALLSIILFIVLSSLVQSLYEVTEPVVMALGASEVRINRVSLTKHVRAVVLCLVLVLFPLYMTYVLCQVLDLDFWSLIVISTCLVTSVQVREKLSSVAIGRTDYGYECLLRKGQSWDRNIVNG
jgi:hypothetical protein